MPRAHKVINARDCVFDETNFYSPDPPNHLIDDISGEVIEAEPLSYAEFMSIIQDISIEPISEDLPDDDIPSIQADQLESTINDHINGHNNGYI